MAPYARIRLKQGKTRVWNAAGEEPKPALPVSNLVRRQQRALLVLGRWAATPSCNWSCAANVKPRTNSSPACLPLGLLRLPVGKQLASMPHRRDGGYCSRA